MDDIAAAAQVMQARIDDLRAAMTAAGLDGFLIPRGDEHLGEYVHESAERLAYVSGFTGSAGLACVLRDRAFIWSDGRYVLQLATQTEPSIWQRLHLIEDAPAAFLARAAAGLRIGYDPWLHPAEQVEKFTASGVTLVPVERNLVDQVWKDRPAPALAPALPHDLRFAGQSAEAKRERIAESLRDAKLDAAVITDPASLAWLLNLRGADVECTPFALGFVLIGADAQCELFMAPEKLPEATRAHLGNHVAAHPRSALPARLQALHGKRVRVDLGGSPAWFAQTLAAAGAIVSDGADPCAEPRARKNAVERAGAAEAHRIDGAAMCRFLHWFAQNGRGCSEIDLAARLHESRAQHPAFKGDSFPAISGAGPNGAIIHYRVTPQSNRVLNANEVYLIDSGGQYFEGTTDITRTLWSGPDAPPAAIRARFTRVLKGHIALSRLVFPDNTAGVRLDAFARASLWQAGLDYDHGTGHGVGSYLSVHEGPASISPHLRPAGIREGMIMSNEPGYYLPGAYGIRIENLVLVEDAQLEAAKTFLRFTPLTLVPIERALIDPALLGAEDTAWLDAYHARVLHEIAPLLAGGARDWLAQACAPLAGAV